MENATLRGIDLRPHYQIAGCGDYTAIDQFYNPVLSVARQYDRMSGFFSSHVLALSAQGVAALITRGGKMRLICSPHLSPSDIRVLENPEEASFACFTDRYFNKYFSFEESNIRSNHVAAMAWMLKEGFLEIRLAVVTDEEGHIKTDSLFHPKVGIVIDDQGDTISFSGSNNETASGWSENQEEFKVFKAWEPGQGQFVESDKESFCAYWEGRASNVRCFDLPTAFKERLIQRSEHFSKEDYVQANYLNRVQRQNAWGKLALFDYQLAAINKWTANCNHLMFEMATGSGKTRCAIGCINRFIETNLLRPVCIVVAVPTKDLVTQWEKELEGTICERSKVVVADSRPEHNNWRASITRTYASFAVNTYSQRVLIILTTHATASSHDFIEIACDMASVSTIMLVGDEVHGMGAREYRKGLLESYQGRLGLSATPERMFDERGTRFLKEYFGDDKYEFTIRDALAHDRVCPYEYHPIVVSLTEAEQERYDALSERIRKLSGIVESTGDAKEKLERLLEERALIISAAENKIPALRELITHQADIWGSHVLAFACPKNFSHCLCVLNNGGLLTSPFTFKQKNRQEILKEFANGGYKALLAMKCLDEGIDVPDAHIAILVSSSTNPREYIQRIGRVIRKAPGKRIAAIYDFLVKPKSSQDELLQRDYSRAEYIAETAQNAYEAIEVLFPYL